MSMSIRAIALFAFLMFGSASAVGANSPGASMALAEDTLWCVTNDCLFEWYDKGDSVPAGSEYLSGLITQGKGGRDFLWCLSNDCLFNSD